MDTSAIKHEIPTTKQPSIDTNQPKQLRESTTSQSPFLPRVTRESGLRTILKAKIPQQPPKQCYTKHVEKDDDGWYTCDHCEMQYLIKKSFVGHLRLKHGIHVLTLAERKRLENGSVKYDDQMDVDVEAEVLFNG